MIDKEVFLKVLPKKVEALKVGHYLDIRTYKRNRKVLLIKRGEEDFEVIEDGFYQDRFEIKGYKELRKLFKKLLQKEFPRSHKIRIYEMGEFSWDKVKNTTFKKL
ncbi:MAG: hypothetical protein GXO57_01915 [Thermodesulfobacteria bacterium]|nr:hypothetical protein [Thermodesulfobacteriota bacterium]